MRAKGRSGAEAAVPVRVGAQSAQEVDPAELGPVDLAEVVLAVRGLPQQEAGQALLPRRSDDEVGVGLTAGVEMLADLLADESADADGRLSRAVAQVVDEMGRYQSSRGEAYSAYQALSSIDPQTLIARIAAAMAGGSGDDLSVGDDPTFRPFTDRLHAMGLKVGFTNGCFDILHRGHVAYLAQARSWCDRLVVALNTDASVKRLKGEGRPVNDLDSRAVVIGGLASVDRVTSFDDPTPIALIERLRPDVLIKGSDYTREGVVGGDLVESWGGEVKLAASTEFVTSPAALPAFQATYGFQLAPAQLVQLSGGDTAATIAAAAQQTSGVNAAMVYGTDGGIEPAGLVVMEDDKAVQPFYQPAPVVRAGVLEEYPKIPEVLNPIFAGLDLATLQELNARIQVGGEPAAAVAEDYLTRKGLIE